MEGGLFQRMHGIERFGSLDPFVPVGAVDGFGESVVIEIAYRSSQRENARLLQVRAVRRTGCTGCRGPNDARDRGVAVTGGSTD